MAPNYISFLLFFALIFTVSRYLRGIVARQYLLTGSSLLLYALWDWRFVPVLLGISAITYFSGIAIVSSSVRNVRAVVTVAICSILLMLLGFKYTNFLLSTVSDIQRLFGMQGDLLRFDLIFPLGISYYTFRAISYVVDVRNDHANLERKFHLVVLYIGFFPILTAGPITRAHPFIAQTHQLPHASAEDLAKGLQQFVIGFVMKSVIADSLAGIAQPVLSAPTEWSQTGIWIGSIACYGQLYFDFAGYSLMAIGCSRWLGLLVPQNFNWPTRATSISEYWQRWHMTLSSWLRDYLYFPLGGSRGKPYRSYVNLFVVMLISGLWHGPSWNFVAWGAMHGFALMAFKAWRSSVPWSGPLNHYKMWTAFCLVLTQFFILLTRIVFGTNSLEKAAVVMKSLFISAGSYAQDYPLWLLIPIAFPIVVDALVGPRTLGMNRSFELQPRTIAFGLGLVVSAMLWLVPLSRIPFVYVQF